MSTAADKWYFIKHFIFNANLGTFLGGTSECKIYDVVGGVPWNSRLRTRKIFKIRVGTGRVCTKIIWKYFEFLVPIITRYLLSPVTFLPACPMSKSRRVPILLRHTLSRDLWGQCESSIADFEIVHKETLRYGTIHIIQFGNLGNERTGRSRYGSF